MITKHNALETAIELINMPSRIHAIKSSPLPDNVEQLLRIAAGEELAINEAATITKRSSDFIKEAAEFFIEQIMLFPEADNYRILGADPEMSKQQLRAQMALLIKWLHPDHAAKGMRTIFISRVTGAWDSLKTDERRAAYDRKLLQQHRQSKQKHHSQKVTKTRRKKRTATSRAPGGTKQAFRHPSGKRAIAKHRQRPANVQKQRLGLFRRIMLALFNKTIR